MTVCSLNASQFKKIDARPHSKLGASVASPVIAAFSESFTLFNFTERIAMSAPLDGARPEKKTAEFE
jgi:hypothetical protein